MDKTYANDGEVITDQPETLESIFIQGDTRKQSIFEKIMEFSHKRMQVEH